MMGLLLLISVSFSIPSAGPQKSVYQVEWKNTDKPDHNKNLFELTQNHQRFSLAFRDFHFRILSSLDQFQIQAKANSRTCRVPNSSFQFYRSFLPSDDDDYLLIG